MKFSITKARKNDIPAIRRFLIRRWKETYDLPLAVIYKELAREILAKEIQSSKMGFFLARGVQRRILGMVAVINKERGNLFCSKLYVHLRYQRKGVGTLLLNRAIEHFPEVKKVQVAVMEDSRQALNFYLKQGFKKIKRTTDKRGKTILKLVIMEKKISKR